MQATRFRFWFTAWSNNLLHSTIGLRTAAPKILLPLPQFRSAFRNQKPEDIQRCSPILPLKHQHNHDNNNNRYHQRNVGGSQLCHANYERAESTEQRQRQPHRKQWQCRSGRSRSRSGRSRQSRSISSYGVNRAVEPRGDNQEEIPIWISGEPRYVSGVISSTTCNDIIEALIADEIRNGNYAYCQRSKGGAASRDYSDYVITENWRGIERSYNGNMAILPVWKAWSRVHNELRLCLKHRKDIKDPTTNLKNNSTLASLRKYICNLFKRNTKQKPTTEAANKDKNPCKTSDEFVLVLLPDRTYGQSVIKKYKPRSTNRKTTHDPSKRRAETRLNEKLAKLSESRISTHRRRSTNRCKSKRVLDPNGYIRRRKNALIHCSIRNKLAQKCSEIDELCEREYALTRQLTNKCKLYKLQNGLYTNSDKRLEISIGQVQQSIEAYAKDIIRTEHELLEIKNEIRQDISIINDLKRLTLDAKADECGGTVAPPVSGPVPAAKDPNDGKMQFVDNIYEFCDNNASMLV